MCFVHVGPFELRGSTHTSVKIVQSYYKAGLCRIFKQTRSTYLPKKDSEPELYQLVKHIKNILVTWPLPKVFIYLFVVVGFFFGGGGERGEEG